MCVLPTMVIMGAREEQGGHSRRGCSRSRFARRWKRPSKKERNLHKQGLRSRCCRCSFIDKVANYRTTTNKATARNGKLAQWFERGLPGVFPSSPLFQPKLSQRR